MTTRSRRRSAPLSLTSPSPSFFSSSSEVSFLAVLCSLLIFFALSFVIAAPLSLAANFEANKANVTVELNATEESSFNSSDSNNGTRNRLKEDSFADIIDRAFEKEFNESEDQNEANDAGSFNNSVAEQQAVLETVARVKPKKNETKAKEENPFKLHHVFNLDNDNGAEETPTLIDRKDNVFIISNLKSKYPVLQLDLRLISDLVVVIVSATCGGIAFACAGQPV